MSPVFCSVDEAEADMRSVEANDDPFDADGDVPTVMVGVLGIFEQMPNSSWISLQFSLPGVRVTFRDESFRANA